MLLPNQFNSAPLGNYLYVYRDSTRALTINDMIKRKYPFQKINQDIPTFGWDAAGAYWLTFRVMNTSNQQQTFLLDVYDGRLEELSCFILTDDSLVSAKKQDWYKPFAQRDYPHRHHVFELNLATNRTYQYYLRIAGKTYELRFPAYFRSQPDMHRTTSAANLYHGGVIGVLSLLWLASCLVSVYAFNWLYVYYLLYISSLLLNHSLNEELLFQFFPSLIGTQFGKLGFVNGPLLIATTSLLFVKRLLSVDQQLAKWVQLLTSLAVSTNIALIVIQFLVPVHLLGVPFLRLLATLALGGSIIASGTMLVNGLLRNNVYAKFYFFSLLPFIAITVNKLLIEFGVASYSWVFDDGITRANLVEAMVLAVAIGYQFLSQKKQNEALGAKVVKHQQELLEEQIRAQESERQRIAADLHDDVGNTLAAAKGSLSIISKKLLIQAEFPEVAKAQSLIEKAGQDLRTISHNLMPIEFDKYKLSDVVSQLVARANQPTAGISFDFILAGSEHQLVPERSLVVYRIINELINNILRHSGAKKAVVQLIFQPESLVVTVEDDGRGFQWVNSASGSSGIGLKNVSSRSDYIGATLDISSDASGTCVIVEVPYA
ncbi:hypothetical protein GCM10027592_31770 [Spirosoma flavus]